MVWIVLYLLMVWNQFTANDSKIYAGQLCLCNVSKDFSAEYFKKTRLYEYSLDFSDNFYSIDDDYILAIHKYLIVKNNIK